MTRRLARTGIALALLMTAPPRAAAEIVVGAPLPLTGAAEPASVAALTSALEAAVGALNAEGGVLGETVRLAVEDDGCAAESGEIAARALVAMKPALVVGHICSSAANSAAPLYAGAGLLFISPGARHPAFTDRRAGATIFRLAGRDDRQGAEAAAWLIEAAPGGRIAFVHDRTRYARAVAESAARALVAAGKSEPAIVAIVAGEKDYPEVARVAGEKRAEAVFFAGYPPEAAIVLENLQSVAPVPRFLGTDSLATADFAARIERNPTMARNVRVLVPAERGKFASQEAEGASAATVLAARARGAIEIWAAAVREAGSTDVERLAPILAGTEFATRALGPVRFDAKGDAQVPSYVPAAADGLRWTTDNATAAASGLGP